MGGGFPAFLGLNRTGARFRLLGLNREMGSGAGTEGGFTGLGAGGTIRGPEAFAGLETGVIRGPAALAGLAVPGAIRGFGTARGGAGAATIWMVSAIGGGTRLAD